MSGAEMQSGLVVLWPKAPLTPTPSIQYATRPCTIVSRCKACRATESNKRLSTEIAKVFTRGSQKPLKSQESPKKVSRTAATEARKAAEEAEASSSPSASSSALAAKGGHKVSRVEIKVKTEKPSKAGTFF
jgi:hypothetical protein